MFNRMILSPRLTALIRTTLVVLVLWFTVASVSAQTSGISDPAPGQVVSGVVIVNGTATSIDFLRYELAFFNDANPGNGWIVFADGDQPVQDGTLAVWDTTVGQNVNAPIFPDGSYQLRLRVVRTDFNYDEFFVGNLVIENGTSAELPTQEPPPPPPTETPLPPDEEQPQPPATETVAPVAPAETPGEDEATPTPTETPTPIPTATPLPTRDAPTPIPTIVLEPTLEAPPEVLPTLTAFPSPTPEATRDQTAFNLVIPEDDGTSEQQIEGVNGLVEAVFGYDYGTLGNAFSRGVQLAFLLFAVIAIYILVRTTVRWLWETISSNW